MLTWGALFCFLCLSREPHLPFFLFLFFFLGTLSHWTAKPLVREPLSLWLERLYLVHYYYYYYMNFLLLLHIKACLAYIKYINKNIFNNFLIAESRRTRTHFFQKLPSPAPAPESRNAPVLHSLWTSLSL